jgi:hypothetical protein
MRRQFRFRRRGEPACRMEEVMPPEQTALVAPRTLPDDGLVVFLKATCPTCRLVAPPGFTPRFAAAGPAAGFARKASR